MISFERWETAKTKWFHKTRIHMRGKWTPLYKFTLVEEAFPINLAFKLPKRVAYWAAVRVAAYATTTEEYRSVTPDDVTIPMMLEAWDGA